MKIFFYCGTILTLLSIPQVYAQNNETETNIGAIQDSKIAQLKHKADGILDTQFKAMDNNRDDRVSKDEFIKFKMQEFQKKQAQLFDGMDKNHDGSLSKVEFEDSTHKNYK